MSQSLPPDLNALIDLARGTKFESVARDEKKLEELLLKEMQASEDPMTREIGSGIADGTMTWRTVASTSAYATTSTEVSRPCSASTSARRSKRWQPSGWPTNGTPSK